MPGFLTRLRREGKLHAGEDDPLDGHFQEVILKGSHTGSLGPGIEELPLDR